MGGVVSAGCVQPQVWQLSCRPWARRRVVLAVRSKGDRGGVPAAAYYSAREEGTGGAGTLGESLWCPYVPLSRD